MTHSMTGFSRVQCDADSITFCWELKSVNHRYLDVSFRLPEAFSSIEMALRSKLRGKLHRGKLECQLKVIEMNANEQSLEIDQNLVHSLLAAGEKLAGTYQIANDLSVSQLLTWPNLIQAKRIDVQSHETLLENSFSEAILQLLQVRLIEGNALKDFIRTRLHKLGEEIICAQTQVEKALNNAREKLQNRLDELNLSVGENRIEQEIALILARLDVSEELDRLQAHITEVDKVLESDQSVGKRLDFLMQELNREANTLSSKSGSVELTQHGVEMKVLIEQMREQVQNIE